MVIYMFYDTAKIFVKGGDGGNGCVAFRREKYLPRGGPAGGDGGRGGNVILRVDGGLSTLLDFHYRKHYRAGRGRHGEGKEKHGRSGDDLVIRVPAGTVVRDAGSGQVLADLTEDGETIVAARGGRGGRGNARFATAKNKAPSFAEKGEPGEERWLLLELKLLADVGLVGYPNAGKSTIISRVSAAKPKIAGYPFTTLAPNLGMVRAGDYSYVMADIPGLIEGAHAGAGLGIRFLRHTERTRLLVHVIDISGIEGRDPVQDFYTVKRELSMYDERLARRPQLVAANKIDLPGAGENLARLRREIGGEYEIFPVSAATGQGLNKLVFRAGELLSRLPPSESFLDEAAGEDAGEFAAGDVTEAALKNGRPEQRFTICKENGIFVVAGREIERHVAMTDMENEEAVGRLQRIMKRMGIEEALKKAGAEAGDTVKIRDINFEFIP